MDAISYSAARANLAKTMDKVCADHAPIITRKSESPVVMLSQFTANRQKNRAD